MSLCYEFQKWTKLSLAGIAISLSVGLVLQYAHGSEHDDMVNELLSNGYNVKHLQGQNITKLLNNSIYGEDDPEITCTGVSWMNQTSTSCSLLNLTKLNEDFEKMGVEREKTEEDFIKNFTK
jgi:hypothetical protein